MIVSEKFKFVFIHNPKTGGTSLQKYFRVLLKIPKDEKYHWHSTYMDISQELKDYFKFGFVRNPWDRYVSMYKFTIGSWKFMQGVSFEEFISGLYDRVVLNKKYEGEFPDKIDWFDRQQYQYFCDESDDLSNIDFIGRFENLKSDWDHMFKLIGVSAKMNFHINKTDHIHYSNYYNLDTRDMVSKISHKDIQLFGYEFENKPEKLKKRPKLKKRVKNFSKALFSGTTKCTENVINKRFEICSSCELYKTLGQDKGYCTHEDCRL